MNNNKFLGISLALLIGVGAISGCQAPTASNTKPVVSNTTTTGTNSTTTTPVATTPVATAPVVDYAAPTAKPTAQNFSAEVQEALLMDSEDEKYLEDSDTSLSSDPAFATKSLLGGKAEGTEKADKPQLLAAADLRATVTANATVAPIKANLAAKPRKEIKKAILGNGAVTRNESGALVIDKAKLKDNFKAVKEVAKAQLDKLKFKANAVKTSDVNEVKNDDGSTTKTATVDFENKRTGVKRNIVNVRTVDAGKLENASHELTATHKNFDRTVKRTVTVNDDGSKKIVFSSLVQWKDGRKREVNRETNLDASGNGTAKGTMVITQKDGKVTTHDINVVITGGVPKTTVTDPVTKTSVAVEEKTDGSAFVTTATEGSAPKTETIASVEAKLEATEVIAPVEPTTPASPAPVAPASPAPASPAPATTETK